MNVEPLYVIVLLIFIELLTLMFPSRIRNIVTLGILIITLLFLFTRYPIAYDREALYYIVLIPVFLVLLLPHPNSSSIFSLSMIMALGSIIALMGVDDPILFIAGLEISILASYAVLSIEKNSKAMDAGITYLIAGTLAVVFIALGLFQVYEYSSLFGSLFVIIGGFLELAVFPFYTWGVRVVDKASMPALLSSLIIPKVTVLALLFYKHTVLVGEPLAREMILILAFFSLFAGGLGGLSDSSNPRRTLAYGSILHLGLLLSLVAFGYGEDVFIFYLVCYILSESSYISFIHFMENNKGQGFPSSMDKVVAGLVLASLIGVPPSSTLVAKLLILKELSSITEVFLIFVFSVIITLPMSALYYVKSIERLGFAHNKCVGCTIGILLSQTTLLILLLVAPMISGG